MTSDTDSLRSRLLGTWLMVSSTLEIPDDPSSRSPMYEPNAIGLIIYSSDGYMMSLLRNPDGSQFRSYGGPFSVVEKPGEGTVIVHHVIAADDSQSQYINTEQERTPTIVVEDGVEYLTLSAATHIKGLGQRLVSLKWKRAGSSS